MGPLAWMDLPAIPPVVHPPYTALLSKWLYEIINKVGV